MRTIVVCKCKAKLRRRHSDVKLVKNVARSCDEVLELSGGLRWVRCRVFVNPSISGENVHQESHSLLRLGGTVMASQNRVLG